MQELLRTLGHHPGRVAGVLDFEMRREHSDQLLEAFPILSEGGAGLRDVFYQSFVKPILQLLVDVGFEEVFSWSLPGTSSLTSVISPPLLCLVLNSNS